MKKSYIIPQMEVVCFNQQFHLLAGSIEIGAEGSANDAESRGSSWDDED